LRGVCEQLLFKASIGRARSIQESSAHDSIVARRRHAADFFNSIDPKRASLSRCIKRLDAYSITSSAVTCKVVRT
jgi:hypothetical protein